MMLTPWGPRAVPTGGAGVAAPACSCTLTRAATFFLGGMSCCLFRWWRGRSGGGLRLLDLAEGELDRGLPAEDLHERLHPLGVEVDLGDRGVQRGERPVDDHHRVALVEVGELHLLLLRLLRARSGFDDGRGEHVLDL